MKNKIIQYLLFIIFLFQYLFGQTYEEIQKIQSEYKKVLERQALQKPKHVSDAEKTAQSTALPDKLIYSRKDIESLLANTEKLLERLQFFEDSTDKIPYVGYEIFTKRDTIPFWQNLPIPRDYTLGPGDEVIISLWGEIDSHENEFINRDGQVYIQNIGILNLGDKTVPLAKKYVLSKYSKVYSTLLGKNPKSYVDLTLGELKSVNVHFVGFVNLPGVHMIHPFSNVITGLTQAGGVKINGSLREIQVIRNNKIVGTTDIYSYMFSGKSVGDVRLLDQDIIYVPPRKSTIVITGRVRNPGYYESLQNESVSDIIKVAGGRETRSSESLFIYRDSSNSGNTSYLLDLDGITNFKLSDGDSIHIPIKPEIKQFVYIEGQIKNPGEYPYNKNITLKDLINATMSLNDPDFKQTIDLSNIIVHRKNNAGPKPIKVTVDFKDDFILSNGDYVTIPPTNLLQPIESVHITGEVKTPGIFPVNNMATLADVLDISGGYTNDALRGGIEVFRDSLKIAWGNENFILNNGDSLNVLKKSGVVLVKGEVNNPGYISFNPGDSIKKYIFRAGGYSAFAEVRDILIIYPNGNAIPKSNFSSPKVLEGSTIIVNQRSLTGSKGPKGWEIFSMVSGQAGNIATTLLSVALLMSQVNGGSSGQ